MLNRQEFLEQLRNIVSCENWPIALESWKHCRDTNCLAFALGLDIPDPDYHHFFGGFGNISGSQAKFVGDRIPSSLVAEVFVDTCHTIGLNCRPISSPDHASSTEYVIGLFGVYPSVDNYRSNFQETYYSYDFHLVRRNLDGSWVHKPGWGTDQKPEKVEWKCLQLEYPDRPQYFAISKPN